MEPKWPWLMSKLHLTQRGLLVVLEPVTGVTDGALRVRVALLTSRFDGTVDELLQVVTGLNATQHLGVVLLELVGLGHHTVDVLLAQTPTVVRDGRLGLRAGLLVTGRHVQDSVRVNLERHLDLRLATLGTLQTGDVELAELVTSGSPPR
ncbi:NAD-specific glutamate dehydrogenase [Phytophthora infestans]|uniref:NAD-specific glutamate dehydrogenase n=1 Tax=Phytophthora infestans TaxID=4787 RepID=A0A8S9TVX5_PHYIN|nr:NAD-specific glutamate dehydrogenase [Phytophthora infestans]